MQEKHTSEVHQVREKTSQGVQYPLHKKFMENYSQNLSVIAYFDTTKHILCWLVQNYAGQKKKFRYSEKNKDWTLLIFVEAMNVSQKCPTFPFWEHTQNTRICQEKKERRFIIIQWIHTKH